MNIPLNIDWQQILLHLLNFVILAGGLYLLLYKPVGEFMEKRQAHFRELEEEAARKVREAEELKAACQKQLQQAQEEIRSEKAKAREESEQAARQQLERAKAQWDQIVSGARLAAKHAREKALEDAQAQLKELASAAVEKLVYQSTGEAYDRFLDAAEEVERRADET